MAIMVAPIGPPSGVHPIRRGGVPRDGIYHHTIKWLRGKTAKRVDLALRPSIIASSGRGYPDASGVPETGR